MISSGFGTRSNACFPFESTSLLEFTSFYKMMVLSIIACVLSAVLTRSICLWIHFHEKREIDFMIRLRQINTNGQDTWSNSWRAKMSHLCGQSISKTSHHEFYKLRDSAVYFVLNGCQHHTFHCNAICCTTTFGWFSSESVV